MSKMTDKEIIKALKVCAKNETPFCCGECELGENNSSCDCVDRLLKLSLDLINRQQAEIEKLNVELVGMRGACNSYKMHYDNAKAEIENLERVISYLEGVCESTPDKVRAEAIKEFAERLKEHLKGNGGLYCVTTMNAKIDIFVKEMVGEQE